jgi:hypothetical protein
VFLDAITINTPAFAHQILFLGVSMAWKRGHASLPRRA